MHPKEGEGENPFELAPIADLLDEERLNPQ